MEFDGFNLSNPLGTSKSHQECDSPGIPNFYVEGQYNKPFLVVDESTQDITMLDRRKRVVQKIHIYPSEMGCDYSQTQPLLSQENNTYSAAPNDLNDSVQRVIEDARDNKAHNAGGALSALELYPCDRCMFEYSGFYRRGLYDENTGLEGLRISPRDWGIDLTL
ncbi:MAG: hypothetical protein HY831_03055 [Candidatus Aenigmarchaeota archaeon]|nr:hypothetical protein [Candidatus Aenigmarchaeota archaeon]